VVLTLQEPTPRAKNHMNIDLVIHRMHIWKLGLTIGDILFITSSGGFAIAQYQSDCVVEERVRLQMLPKCRLLIGGVPDLAGCEAP